jgi:hypothetical protein
MTETSNAEKLHISDGFVVWIIGQSIEETTLLDPLPEGAETIEERDDDTGEHESIDAALLFVDNRTELIEQLDEVLPQLGSIPVVWITYPIGERSDVDAEGIQELIADYGWRTVEGVDLDETWAAVRLQQA